MVKVMQYVGISKEIHYICTLERTSILMSYETKRLIIICTEQSTYMLATVFRRLIDPE